VSSTSYDAIVIGAGPNGLAAAVHIAEKGHRVLILEAQADIGGGTRTKELTLPGFLHDVCSTTHPLGAGSPYLKTLPLKSYGLEFVHPGSPLAHPLDGGRAVVMDRNIHTTAHQLGKDADAYVRLIGPFVDRWDDLTHHVMKPPRIPRNPLLMARFAKSALRSAESVAKAFKHEEARALFAGHAAHSFLKLDEPLSAAFGITIGASAHAVGWPFASGGSRMITDALAAHLKTLNGEIRTNEPVTNLDDLPPARVVLFDTAPKAMAQIAGEHLPSAFRDRLETFKHAPGVFKLDLALDAPIPWTNEQVHKAGTVHLGGTFEEIADAEAKAVNGEHSEKPFVLVAQASLFDETRAPKGKHTVWAYAHVPNGSDRDMTDEILGQIERFAPGASKRIIGSAAMTAKDLEAYNPNYVGGDIVGGMHDAARIIGGAGHSVNPYATPNPRLYLCSASTPPGAGIHGMCGFNAAEQTLKRLES
jgi:phytoene dehydrogenase-like protein